MTNHFITSGYYFQGSEVYGGLSNTWDYGPLGVELKNNIKQAWWKKFVKTNKYNVGLDAAILMNREVWVASGHIGSFSDPLVDCKKCHSRFRAAKLIEDFTHGAKTGDGMSNEELTKFLNDNIHQYGGAYNICEVCRRVCGKELDVMPLVNYFKDKYE